MVWTYNFLINVKQNGKVSHCLFTGTEKKARSFVLNNVLKGKIGSAEFIDSNGGADMYTVGRLWNEGGKWYYCDAWNTYKVGKDGGIRLFSDKTKIKNGGW